MSDSEWPCVRHELAKSTAVGRKMEDYHYCHPWAIWLDEQGGDKVPSYWGAKKDSYPYFALAPRFNCPTFPVQSHMVEMWGVSSMEDRYYSVPPFWISAAWQSLSPAQCWAGLSTSRSLRYSIVG